MRRTLCVIVFLCLMVTRALASVQIDKVHFHDDTFRRVVYEEYDKDKDWELSDEEIEAVDEIVLHRPTLGGVGMYSVEGIGYFTELVSLDLWNNPITELDLSNNKKLRHVECQQNYTIRKLNVSGLTELVFLNCSTNSLTELNLTGCTSLAELICDTNYLEHLNLTGNTQLSSLVCGDNKLKELNISNLRYLWYLDCGTNYLETLNASGCVWLERVYADKNRLKSVNFDECGDLMEISLKNNRLTELILTGKNNLWDLDCNGNILVSLDVSGCEKLYDIDCSDNALRSLKLQKCTALRFINCENNQLDEIDVTQCGRNLEWLYCGGNRLTALNLSDNYGLTRLHCGNNYLTELDLDGNTKLYDLELQNNHIAELSLSRNSILGTITESFSIEVDTPYSTVTHYIYPSNLHISMDKQTLSSLDIARQPGNAYPYALDFYGYISTTNVKNIIGTSVQGFDDENAEIETVYGSGTAQFKALPARVRYSYSTGLEGYSMDVTIGTSELLSLALDGHVYRAFNHSVSWENARAYCRALGGDLAVITTDTEKQLVRELIRKAQFAGGDSSGGYWLGGERDSDDVWQWINGEAFTDKITEVHGGSSSVTEIGRGSKEEGNYEIIRLTKWQSLENINLQMADDGKFVGWHELHLSGFICEWDSVKADMAAYSEAYRSYLTNPSAYTDGEFYGDIPEAVDYSHLSGNLPQIDFADEAPAEYDPRSMGILSSVKNQGSYGTCWSFASLAALEASYIAQGYASEAPDLSELHQAWFVFKDPRPGYAQPLNNASKSVLDQGGNNSMSIAFLSRIGTASEADLPYTSAANVASITSGKYPEDYSHPIRLREAYELGAITQENREYVKHLIMEYGAVRIGYRHSSKGLHGSSYYMPGNEGGGHAVILVGWRDNYPASSFANSPKTNGAWLARNSWGTEWGENGYFWISYAQDIYTCAAYIAAESTVSKLYGHDAVAAVDTVPYKWSANIFKAEGIEILNEVAFYTRDNNTQYEVYVNKFGTTEPENGPGVPQSGPVASGKLPYSGYHTVELNSPTELEDGEYFAVMVKLSSPSGRKYITTAENNNGTSSNANSGKVNASVITAAGMSWFADTDISPQSSDWTDGKRLSGGSYNACIKIFSVENGPVSISMLRLPSGTEGQPYSYALNASGARPITWTVTGLPDGLTHKDGRVTGTPSAAGNYTVNVSATNSKGTDAKSLELVINAADNPSPTPAPISRDVPNKFGSSGGGGGCSSLPAMLGAVILAFTVSRKK